MTSTSREDVILEMREIGDTSQSDVQGAGSFAAQDHAGSSTELQDGPLPSSKAEARLAGSQAASEVSSRNPERLGPFWDLVAIICVLAVAGMIGTHIRIELEEGFNYEGLNLMENWAALFLDLPANMVGSFFMGIVGVTCKAHIQNYSELISLALSTGLMGSITTYSSWNQDMAKLFVAGLWADAIFGILLGLELPIASLVVGMHAGRGLVWLHNRARKRQVLDGRSVPPVTPDNLRRRKTVAWAAAVLWLGILLPSNILIAALKWGDTGRHIQAMAACLAPLGVWARWYLSRYNGTVFKGSGWWWIPWGTLAANVLASVLLTVDNWANVQVTSHVGSVWLAAAGKGVTGGLSTVSTFVVEIYKFAEGKSPWKAYGYIAISLATTQLFAMFLYGIPVWVEGYPRAYPSHSNGVGQ